MYQCVTCVWLFDRLCFCPNKRVRALVVYLRLGRKALIPSMQPLWPIEAYRLFNRSIDTVLDLEVWGFEPPAC